MRGSCTLCTFIHFAQCLCNMAPAFEKLLAFALGCQYDICVFSIKCNTWRQGGSKSLSCGGNVCCAEFFASPSQPSPTQTMEGNPIEVVETP